MNASFSIVPAPKLATFCGALLCLALGCADASSNEVAEGSTSGSSGEPDVASETAATTETTQMPDGSTSSPDAGTTGGGEVESGSEADSSGGKVPGQCEGWSPMGEACEGEDADWAAFEVQDLFGDPSTAMGEQACVLDTIGYPAGEPTQMRFDCETWGDVVVAVPGVVPPLGDYSMLTISRVVSQEEESVVIDTDGEIYFVGVRSTGAEVTAGGFSFTAAGASACDAIELACDGGGTALFQRVSATIAAGDSSTEVFSDANGVISGYDIRVARAVVPACVPEGCTVSESPAGLEGTAFRRNI